MLGFELMSGLENFGSVKLYWRLPGRTRSGRTEKWPNLAPVLSTEMINWELIVQQYDQFVEYTTVLRLTGEAERVLRRFARGGPGSLLPGHL
ncbi:Tn3 family transposase [Streptomyces nogalater]